MKGIAIASATWYSILFSNPCAVVNSFALLIWNGDNEIPVWYNKKEKRKNRNRNVKKNDLKKVNRKERGRCRTKTRDIELFEVS